MEADRATIKKLEKLKAELTALIETLKSGDSEVPGVETGKVCWWCKKPIRDNDATTRGAHASCYSSWHRKYVGAGKEFQTADEAAVAHGLPKPKKAGRKPADLPDMAKVAKERITKRKKKK